MGLNVKLVVVGGEVKTTELKLRLPSTIGRAKGTTIVLPHPLVSRQHCELFEAEGQLRVRDLGSLNGTFVNNQRITTEVELPPNELLTIGSVTFRAVYEPVNGHPADSSAQETAMPDNTAKITPKVNQPAARSIENDITQRSKAITDSAIGRHESANNNSLEEGTLEASDDFGNLLDSGEIGSLDMEEEDIDSRPPLFQMASAPPPAAAKPKAVEPAKPAAAPLAKPVPKPAVPDFSAIGNKDARKKEAAKTNWDEPEDNGKDSDDDDLNDFLKNLK